MPSSRRKCCIAGCGVRSGTFYKFPQRDTSRYNLWIALCHNSARHIQRLRNPLVCRQHFDPKFLGKKKIIPTSYPTLGLDKKLTEYETDDEEEEEDGEDDEDDAVDVGEEIYQYAQNEVTSSCCTNCERYEKNMDAHKTEYAELQQKYKGLEVKLCQVQNEFAATKLMQNTHKIGVKCINLENLRSQQNQASLVKSVIPAAANIPAVITPVLKVIQPQHTVSPMRARPSSNNLTTEERLVQILEENSDKKAKVADTCFLLSLVPSLESMTAAEKCRVKMQILQLITNVEAERTTDKSTSADQPQHMATNDVEMEYFTIKEEKDI